MVSRVCDGYSSVHLIYSDIVGVDHLSIVSSFRSEEKEKGTVEFEDLDSVVVLVGHHDVAFSCGGHPGRSVELSRTTALRTKLELELSADVKDLDTVVATVTDNDVSLLIAADSPWPAELSVAGTFATPVVTHHTEPPVLPSTIHQKSKRTAENVLTTNGHHQLMLSLATWSEVYGIRSVAVVSDVERKRAPRCGCLELNKETFSSVQTLFTESVFRAEYNSTETVHSRMVETLPHCSAERRVRSSREFAQTSQSLACLDGVRLQHEAVVLDGVPREVECVGFLQFSRQLHMRYEHLSPVFFFQGCFSSRIERFEQRQRVVDVFLLSREGLETQFGNSIDLRYYVFLLFSQCFLMQLKHFVNFANGFVFLYSHTVGHFIRCFQGEVQHIHLHLRFAEHHVNVGPCATVSLFEWHTVMARVFLDNTATADDLDTRVTEEGELFVRVSAAGRQLGVVKTFKFHR